MERKIRKEYKLKEKIRMLLNDIVVLESRKHCGLWLEERIKLNKKIDKLKNKKLKYEKKLEVLKNGR